MAISATQLKAILDLGKAQVTSKEIEDTLSVTASWVSKNKQGLKDFGIEVVRAAHKPHKPHKPHKDHGTKGKSPDHFMQRFKDAPIIGSTIYRLNKHLILRYLTNKVFEENSLPKIAVITEPSNLLELVAAKVDAELSDPKALKDYVDWVLNQHMPDTNSEIDYMTQRVLSGKQYLPSEIKYCLIALKHVLDSLEYLKPQEIPNVPRVIIEEAFAEVVGKDKTPSEEQIQCLYKIYGYGVGFFAKDERTISIQADAGVSKTTIALVAQHMLKDINPYIAAVTNKSLNRKGKCMTIHSFLLKYAGIDNIKDSFQTKVLLSERAANKVDLLIVDESSQVDYLTRTLLETMCKRVLYIGDIKQLPPINGIKGVERALLGTLTEQFRFSNAEDTFSKCYTEYNKSMDTEAMEELLKSKTVGQCKTVSKEVKVRRQIIKLYDFKNTFAEYEDLIREYSSDDHQIIAYTNQFVDEVNRIANGGDSLLKVGSKVILTLNDYEQEQYNGFQFRIIDIQRVKKSSIYLCKSLESGEEYEFKERHLELGYCITTAKSQGSSFKHVLGILNTAPAVYWLDSYVMATRPEETIKFLRVEDETLTALDMIKVFRDLDIDRVGEEAVKKSLQELLKDCVRALEFNPEVILKIREEVRLKGLPEETIEEALKT